MTKHKTHEEFIAELAKKNPDIEVQGTYKGANVKTLVSCKKCQYEWLARPTNLLHQGSGCPNCSHSATSFAEQFIYEYLSQAFGSNTVQHRNRTAIGKELDIYMPSMKFAIEFGSWYWHKDRVKDDTEKRELCRSRGIHLVTVYDSFPEEEAVNFDKTGDVITFPFDLNQEDRIGLLINILSSALQKQGIEFDGSAIDMDDTIRRAHENSCKKNTDQFKKQLAEVNPDIEVLGRYEGATIKTLVRCKRQGCGYEWESLPHNLLRGSGCPKCSGVKKRTHAEFVKELAEKNPKIEVIGTYITNSTKLLVRCMKCNHEWEVIPLSLLKGHSCPKCAGKMKRTHNEFVKILAKKNPDIEVKGRYINNRTKILVRCRKPGCGCEWEVTPGGLFQGTGCPKCTGNKKKTTAEFIQELAVKYPDITVLGEYINDGTKIQVASKKCGHKWEASPSQLLRGRNCPKCRGKRAWETRRKNQTLE